jgi:nucleoid-associated protein YgaU
MSVSGFNILEAAGGIGALLGIGGTAVPKFSSAGTIMSLGDGDGKFYFFDTEVPENLPFGGDMVSTLHQFPGGARAVDTFGDQPRSLDFSGKLLSLGPKQLSPNTGTAYAQKAMTALQRMQLLHQLYVAGKPLTWRYDLFEFQVVIAKFLPDIKHENLVEYSISLHVLSDNVDKFLPNKQRNAALTPNPFANLLGKLTNFLKKAEKVTKLLGALLLAAQGLAGLMKSDAGRKKLLFAGVSLIPGSAEFTRLITAVQNVDSTLRTMTTDTHPQTVLDMQAVQPVETLPPEAIDGQVLPQLKKLAGETRTLMAFSTNDYVKFNTHDPVLAGQVASEMRAYYSSILQLIRAFQLLLQPTRVRVERLQNPNLYELAAKYYRDASKWTTIAQANKFLTPQPIGLFYVKIPFEDLAPNVGGTVGVG